tara:strand:+ start:271 stop:468 length:198 start_codon:yes stop_codon:yes gene_type:complete
MPKRVLPLIPVPLVVDHVQQIANEVIVHCRARSPVARCRIVDSYRRGCTAGTIGGLLICPGKDDQ